MYIFTDNDFATEAESLARASGEHYSKFDKDCSKEMKEGCKRITFLGHGKVKGDEIVFGEENLNPQAFFDKLVEYNLINKEEDITIDIIGCYVGLLQDKPTYLALFAETLQDAGYNNVQVRGVNYTDLEKKFVSMSMVLSLNQQSHVVEALTCVLFDPEQAEARQSYDTLVTSIQRPIKLKSAQLNRIEGKIRYINELEQSIKELSSSNKPYKPEEYDGIGTKEEYIRIMSFDLEEEKGMLSTYEKNRAELKADLAPLLKERVDYHTQYKHKLGRATEQVIFEAPGNNIRVKLDEHQYLITGNTANEQRATITQHNPAQQQDDKGAKKQKIIHAIDDLSPHTASTSANVSSPEMTLPISTTTQVVSSTSSSTAIITDGLGIRSQPLAMPLTLASPPRLASTPEFAPVTTSSSSVSLSAPTPTDTTISSEKISQTEILNKNRLG